MVRDFPTGTVTFLFTDVEASTRLWEESSARAGEAFARHDEIIETLVDSHGGVVVRPRGEGDSRFCVFDGARDAIGAAVAIQLALLKEPWELSRPLRVRIGVHSGEAELRAGDYYGTAVNRCARLRGLGWGGQTLVSSATRTLAGDGLPEGVGLKDLGEHHLRDLAEPERVYQITHPDLPDGFGPLRSVDTVRNNLPVELTSFIGREPQVSAVKKLVGRDRLVTLHGVGGCGKTRLALQVADESIGTFADGEWFVELAAISDESLIVDAVASAIGLRDVSGRPGEAETRETLDPLEHLLGYLRTRHLLLVLDNCEHLVGPVAVLCERVLQSCPSVHILTTSREALGIDAETAWRVPSLTTPPRDQDPSLEELSGYEACRLFVERARQRRADLLLVERDARAIADICTRLDGIPLAIELAAARVKVLTPSQIADRLGDFFRLLVGGSRTRMERQQTLRAAIDWSYEPLGERERILFRRLSVFAGSFSLPAAEALCAGHGLDSAEIFDLLSSLVDKSMLEAEPSRGETRYRMLETFRQYAREKLVEAAESDDVRVRHLGWFIELAERARAELTGPRQIEWLRRLDAEYDNLRAGLEFAFDAGRESDALRLASALGDYWTRRGHATEGRSWLARLIRAVPDAPAETTARALLAAAELAWAQGDLPAGRALFERFASVVEDVDDTRLRVAALITTGMRCLLDGDPARAQENGARGVELGRSADDPSSVAIALVMVSQILMAVGDVDTAARHLQEALGQARRAGDIGAIALASVMLSELESDRGRFADAERHALTAVDLGRAMGDGYTLARALTALARLALGVGDLVSARTHIAEGRARDEEIGGGFPWWWRSLEGYCALYEGDPAGARLAFLEMASTAEAAGHGPALAEAWLGLARVARAMGEPSRGLEHARRAIELWPIRGTGGRIPLCLESVAGCLIDLGEHERAATLLGVADAMREQTGQPPYPVAKPLLDADLAAVRSVLDDRFEAVFAAGRALEGDAGVELALECARAPHA